jgi:hypothetical protein
VKKTVQSIVWRRHAGIRTTYERNGQQVPATVGKKNNRKNQHRSPAGTQRIPTQTATYFSGRRGNVHVLQVRGSANTEQSRHSAYKKTSKFSTRRLVAYPFSAARPAQYSQRAQSGARAGRTANNAAQVRRPVFPPLRVYRHTV